MAEKRKIDRFPSGAKVPEKYCEVCGQRMWPVQYPGGAKEGPTRFAARSACGEKCRPHISRLNTQLGRRVDANNCVWVRDRNHFTAGENGWHLLHRLIAERTLGKPLPSGAQVHHVDGDRTNNHPSNLVICEDQKYHALIDRRSRALRECGDADWLKCGYCGEWEDPEQMYVRPNGRSGVHRRCRREYQQQRRHGISLADEAERIGDEYSEREAG